MKQLGAIIQAAIFFLVVFLIAEFVIGAVLVSLLNILLTTSFTILQGFAFVTLLTISVVWLKGLLKRTN